MIFLPGLNKRGSTTSTTANFPTEKGPFVKTTVYCGEHQVSSSGGSLSLENDVSPYCEWVLQTDTDNGIVIKIEVSRNR